MSSSSLDDVRITTGRQRVLGSSRIRRSTSMPPTLGSFKSRRTMAGGSDAASPKRYSISSEPSRATCTSLAIFALRSDRSTSSSSSGLSSTRRMVLGDMGFLDAVNGFAVDQLRQALCRECAREEESLGLVAFHRLQRPHLLGVLD